MTYRYKTPVGTFVITPQRTDSNRVELWVADECYGSYLSARMAASDVYAHSTGFYAWDSAAHLQASEDLGDWEQI